MSDGLSFEEYLERTVPYFDAVRAAGGEPWWQSEEDRRRLWFRRYQRPAPPEGLLTSYEDIVKGKK